MKRAGSNRRYCLQGISEHGVGDGGYKSGEACLVYSVHWETELAGSVLSKHGSVPVQGVEIGWKITDGSSGKAQSRGGARAVLGSCYGGATMVLRWCLSGA